MATLNIGRVRLLCKGDYSPEATYDFFDWVTYDGSSYVVIAPTGSPAGTLPTDTNYWNLLADKGDKGDIGETGPQGPKGDTGNGVYIGQLVMSLIPISGADVHLLDGSLFLVGGIYDAFITHIASLQTSYPGLFTTEDSWQSSVTSYGVCGKFVYTEGVSLRLPKVTGFVEGTLDSTALGDLVEAGLPNVSGSLNGYLLAGKPSPTGMFSSTVVKTSVPDYINGSALNWNIIGGGGEYFVTLNADASRANPIYGKSTTVQPQAIKGYLYMVVATATKTDVQVNIDNITTDLNGKAGTDLSNLSTVGKAVIANLGMPSSRAVPLTYTEEGQFTVPADGYVVLRAETSKGGIYIVNLSNGIIVSSISERVWALGCTLPVKKGDIVQVKSWQASSHSLFFLYAEGSQP